jgi:hypothetical protein
LEDIQIQYQREIAELRLKNQREVEEIRRKNAQRAEEERIAHEQRLEDIRRQREAEIREATIGYADALEELERSLDQQRQDRLLKLAQQNEDLRQIRDERLRDVAEGLQEELGITAEGYQAIYDVLLEYLGPGGATDRIFQYYVESAEAAALAAVQVIAKSLSKIGSAKINIGKGGTDTGGTLPRNQPGFAEGGVAYANRPTLVQFGEVPEIAMFKPLSSFRSPSPSGRGGGTGMGEGRARVEIMLEPGLVGRIIDGSLDEVATLIERTFPSR